MLQKAGPERCLEIQKVFLRGFPEKNLRGFLSALAFPPVSWQYFFLKCWISQPQSSDGNFCFLCGSVGESIGCCLPKSLVPGLGVQHLPRAAVCLVFHHLHTFLATSSNFPAPNLLFRALHAVHKMSCLIVCSSLGWLLRAVGRCSILLLPSILPSNIS